MAGEDFEVAIVGGGPAGLSAALVLGRCLRRVVLFEGGEHRNAAARIVHGFMTRDGVAPEELRRLALAEIAGYRTVDIRRGQVTAASREDRSFRLEIAGGRTVRCQVLLLATGLCDVLPEIPGARALFGERLFHCPYCDGWELRGQPLAAIAQPDDRGGQFGLVLSQWTSDLVLFGSAGKLSAEMSSRLAVRGVPVDDRRPVALERDGDGVRVRLADGNSLWRRAVFFHLGAYQRSDLARSLGARMDEQGGVDVDRKCATSVDGLYVAGDSSRDVLQAVVAAGEGAAAAVAINARLCTG